MCLEMMLVGQTPVRNRFLYRKSPCMKLSGFMQGMRLDKAYSCTCGCFQTYQTTAPFTYSV